MKNETLIKIPLLNANETEVLITELLVSIGDKIESGDILASLESTKSSEEIQSETDGFIQQINFSENEYANVGDTLFIITPEFDKNYQPQKTSDEESLNIANLKISKPALEFAQKNSIDLTQIDTNQFITIAFLQALLPNQEAKVEASQIKENSLVIVGGGGHCKALIDLLRAENKYHILGVIDDDPAVTHVLDVSVIGNSNTLPDLVQKGLKMAINAIGGISNIKVRIKIDQKIKAARLSIPTVIHPTAHLEPSANLEDGIQIFAHAYVGSAANIKENALINTSVIISHDCRIAPMANLSPGAILAGNVSIGQNTLIGMGVTINLGVQIGENCKIGNSAVIKSSVKDNSIIHAGAIHPPIEKV